MNDQTKSQNTYLFDPEGSEESARLLVQDQLITKAMGGSLTGLPDLPKRASVLDLACGPGGWVLDVAAARPDAQVWGIDISQTTVDGANARARLHKRLNASFGVMDLCHPLDFRDHSFDLVNGRFLYGVLPTSNWPALLQECRRITRPGGILRLTDSEWICTTNSPACAKIGLLSPQILHRTGHGFFADGYAFGITPVAARLLQQAGFQQIQQSISMINYSAGTEAWPIFSLNMEIAFTQLARLARNMGAEDIPDALLQQAFREMQHEDFCGLFWFLTTWGINPAA